MDSTYSLYKLADKNFLKIPDLQRGLVWNAARIESLWDSIVRGIPIGAISVRNGEVFDGQQRRHAIQVGLNYDPTQKDDEILWIDLIKGEDVENRIYSFRVTTPAHPWGYKVSKDDRSNSLLSHSERRSAIEWMAEHNFKWERSSDVSERPYPYEMIPWASELPVPFPVLDAFVKEFRSNRSLADFSKFISKRYSQQNWCRYFIKALPNIEVDVKYWDEILSDIEQLKDYRVLVIDASLVKDSDVGLYFKRMNKNGEEPSSDEIQYSLLKSRLGILKKLDLHAKGFSSSASLAQMAMCYYKSRQGEKLVLSVTDKDVSTFANQAEFEEFITGELQNLMSGADSLLRIGVEDGLLPWHRTRICNSSWPLYMYLMRESRNPQSDVNYAGLALMIRVFANDLNSAVKELWEAKSVREGLRTCIEKEFLARPLYVEELVFLSSEALVEGVNWHRKLLSKMNELNERIRFFYNGFDSKRASVELLLYGCRQFMSEIFGKYDASDSRWIEQNIPWDYDHILPKVWIHSNILTGNEYTELCKKFLWSIGNSAPIPFAINRSKNADAPGHNYPFGDCYGGRNYGNELKADLGAIEKYEYHWRYFDDNDNVKGIKNFVKTTAQRFYALYKDVFKTLSWGSLLQMGLERDFRFEMLSRVAERVHGEVFASIGKERIKLVRDPTPENLLLRATMKYQLCVPVKSVVVCFETHDRMCRKGWIGVCRRNDENRVDDSRRDTVAPFIGDGLDRDEDWYGWEEVTGLSEDEIVDSIQKWEERLAGLESW